MGTDISLPEKALAYLETMPLETRTILVAVAVVLVSAMVLLGASLRRPNKEAKPFLNKSRQTITLLQVEQLSPDTKKLRFALPDARMVLGLPVGKHFKVYCPNTKGVVEGEWNGRPDSETGLSEIERKYTPTSSNDEKGCVDLVIKVYKGGVLDRFPDGGKMSQFVGGLSVGDTIEISGPWGLIEYKGRGTWNYGKKELNGIKKVGMLAGGTGITPMLQIIAAVLKDTSDKTKLSLIFANQTEQDILVRDHLEALKAAHPTRFHLWYTLDRPPAQNNWAFSKGFIDEPMIKSHLPGPEPDTLILMCGPPPMIQFACKPNLDKLGYDKKQQLQF